MTSKVEAAPKSPFGWFNLASDGGVPLRALTEDPPIPAMFRPLWDGYTQQDTSALPEAAGAYIRELVTLAQNLTTSSDAFAASRGMCILSAPSPGTRLRALTWAMMRLLFKTDYMPAAKEFVAAVGFGDALSPCEHADKLMDEVKLWAEPDTVNTALMALAALFAGLPKRRPYVLQKTGFLPHAVFLDTTGTISRHALNLLLAALVHADTIPGLVLTLSVDGILGCPACPPRLAVLAAMVERAPELPVHHLLPTEAIVDAADGVLRGLAVRPYCATPAAAKDPAGLDCLRLLTALCARDPAVRAATRRNVLAAGLALAGIYVHGPNTLQAAVTIDFLTGLFADGDPEDADSGRGKLARELLCMNLLHGAVAHLKAVNEASLAKVVPAYKVGLAQPDGKWTPDLGQHVLVHTVAPLWQLLQDVARVAVLKPEDDRESLKINVASLKAIAADTPSPVQKIALEAVAALESAVAVT